MQKIRNLMLIALTLSVSCMPFAQATNNTEQEIQHLFEFISQSDCIFIRNYTEYPAMEARDHMQTKYDYAKRWVGSAEQFIERIATKSSISGNRYQVRCQGELLYTDNWLRQELERYRASQTSEQQTATH
jgi:hypothetical protein